MLPELDVCHTVQEEALLALAAQAKPPGLHCGEEKIPESWTATKVVGIVPLTELGLVPETHGPTHDIFLEENYWHST
ncbi:hypothetical protein BP6252_06374 [Coleophoma cylindrospora]|uniref:Uncharacterized protein n=1 Tax=Coleophoma cylindrospora TaxID=1849047 RepID=A0A3D8RMC0_9HELO|nr:hypothetical protein BP6252_06374 [Coleophoma cylindrospora]